MITAASEEILIRPLPEEDMTAEFLSFLPKSICCDDDGCFGIYLREDESFLGVCLCPGKTEHITIFLKEEFWNQGFGHQALTLCLDLLFGVYGRRKIVAQWDLSSPGALKLLLSCGFEEDVRGGYCLTVSRWERL